VQSRCFALRIVERTSGASTMKFTSRILEGKRCLRGLVEPREGIGCGGGRKTEKGPRGGNHWG